MRKVTNKQQTSIKNHLETYNMVGQYTGLYQKPVFIFILIWIFLLTCVLVNSPNNVWKVRGGNVLQWESNSQLQTNNTLASSITS